MSVLIEKSDNDRARLAAYVSFKNNIYSAYRTHYNKYGFLLFCFYKTNPTMMHRVRSRTAIFALKNSRDL
jgi:hypothetical protein